MCHVVHALAHNPMIATTPALPPPSLFSSSATDKSIITYPTMSDKAHLSVVVCGHVDAGKSTTCGHLIFKCGGIPEREMAKLQEKAEEMGKASFGFAYFLDTCKEERERGVTIQCNTKEFYTEKYHYTIVDAPGHKVSTVVCA